MIVEEKSAKSSLESKSEVSTTNNIVCSNCGQMGHVYRLCPFPVTSYGIICFRMKATNSNSSVRPEYLMVQRKDSLGFVEFVRGKYDIDDRKYVGALLSNMTVSERRMLLESDGNIDTLWSYLWRDLSSNHSKKPSSNIHHSNYHNHNHRNNNGVSKGPFAKDFDEARSKFSKIWTELPVLIETFSSEISETEWGFPKGRRNMNETDLECASREFSEETGFNTKNITFINNDKYVEEMFQGSNGVWYRHVYFVAKASNRTMIGCKDGRYEHCNGEIRAVSWFSYEECCKKIRSAYSQRRIVLDAINSAIIDALKNTTLHTIINPNYNIEIETHQHNAFSNSSKKKRNIGLDSNTKITDATRCTVSSLENSNNTRDDDDDAVIFV